MQDDEKLAALRAGLPAVAAGIYLNTGTAGPLPTETATAMAEIAERELVVGRGHPADADDVVERIDEARASVAAILAADVRSIALTHSTTDAMNIATWALDWQPGDRVVTTRQEHPGGIGAIAALRARRRVEPVFADVGAGEDEATTIARLDEAITPGTRAVVLSHVTWTTGARLPVAAIAELAHARGAAVIVDGAQAAGAIGVDVEALGADFYAVAGHKWLLGPEGMGALYVAPGILDRARMTFGGGLSFASVDSEGRAEPHADARRFQATTFHRPSVVGFARSCGWLSMFVGLEWLHRRGTALARAAAERLAAIPGVTVLTPTDRMATLVTFRIAGWPAEAALDELGARVFAVARTIASLEALRISVGGFTTDEEISRFVGAVELLARHTPATLPPRRLVVLGSDA
jgi:L-cysteine/cystine lyase